MYYSKSRVFVYQIIRVVVFLLSIIATFYVTYNVSYPGFEEIYLLPITYGVVFVFFISPVLFKNTNIIYVVFTAVSFSIYVILAFLIVYTGLYGGRSNIPPVSSSVEIALGLMVYEVIVITIVVFFTFSKYSPKL